jgi:general secretion pathway protein E
MSAFLSFHEYPKEPVVLHNLSVRFMKESRFVPVQVNEGALRIAMADPGDSYTIDALKLAYGLRIEVSRGREEDILSAIERLYGVGSQSLEMIIEEAGKDVYDLSSFNEEDVNHLRDLASEAPIIRLVNRLIFNAVDQQASDIHLEPFEDEFKVRYRIDGVLHEVESPPKRLQAAITSRVKIMAKLDIGERRLPQDGRIKMKIGNKEIDFRISTIPTLHGESVVMRILDRETLVLELEKLGFPQEILLDYKNLILQPYGMILVCGPTGSGKTSTLYTTLARINSSEKKIITLEDPIEYQLKGVNQIQVNPKIGLTFAGGLRSIVRQDPDIILVGEIRDAETAKIAVQSALTGHLLFSTLHTNDACGAITRLLEMGVESFLLNSTLLGALSQRLVRVICPTCKIPVTPDEKLVRSMGEEWENTEGIRFYGGEGCEDCRHTGFRGRTGIFEYLSIDEEIRSEIARNASAERIREVAVKKGMRSLREDGWRNVMEGVTTISEVLRVTLER